MKKTICYIWGALVTTTAVADIAPYYQKDSRTGDEVIEINFTETSHGSCIIDMKTIRYSTHNTRFEYMEKSECSSDNACVRIQAPDSLSQATTWHKIEGMDCAYETDDKTRYYVGELRYDEATFNCYLRYTMYNIRTDSNETFSSCKMHKKFLENKCYEDYANCKSITKEEFEQISLPQLKD